MKLKLKKLGFLVIELILAGSILGLMVSLFQYLAHLINHYGLELIQNTSTWAFIGVLVVTFGYFLGLVILNKKISGFTGSGIAQLEAYHDGWYSFNPFLMLGFIFLNSLSAFYGGFLLGGEGPSVTIGGSLGMIFNKATKKEDKELVAAMSSAAFGVALMAPLAGFFHVIEENKKHLSFSLLFKCLVILAISYTIGYFVFRHQIFNINVTSALTPLYYLYIPLFLLFGILLGRLFQIVLIKFKDLFVKYPVLDYLTPVIAIVFMILRRYIPNFTSSGAGLVTESLIDGAMWMLLLTALWRFIAGGLSSVSKVSGGLTLPTLAYGYLVGSIIVKLISYMDPGIANYGGVFMIVTMIAVFSTVCNTPLAGLFLGLSMGSIEALALPLTITVFLYLIINKFVISWDNIYKDLEKRLPGYKEAHCGTI